MIVSRIAPVAAKSLGAIRTSFKSGILQRRLISTSKPRQGGHGQFYYRQMPPPDPTMERVANVAGAFMWWWIWWHVFTDYEHIIGHEPFPDIGGWTDEELGIPPDDADDPEY